MTILITNLAKKFAKRGKQELTIDELYEYWNLLPPLVQKEIIRQHLNGKIYFRGNPIKIKV